MYKKTKETRSCIMKFNEKTDFLEHDRFAISYTIITDMDSILKTGLSAAKRNIPNKKFGN